MSSMNLTCGLWILVLSLIGTRCGVRGENTDTEEGIDCKVNNPASCDALLLEICSFSNGRYKCTCPPGVSRLEDGKCKVIDECSNPRSNTCDVNANCFDTPESYRCECQPQFTDISRAQSGRICVKKVDECSLRLDDCAHHASCKDTDAFYTCQCHPGFVDVSHPYGVLPGRRCSVGVNECSDPSYNDCHESATCEDALEGYTCQCFDGFVDISPNVTSYPGRDCIKKPVLRIANFVSHQCNHSKQCQNNEFCGQNADGLLVCQCKLGWQRVENGTCKPLGQCQDPLLNECDPNAVCSNVPDSFKCQCKPGFADRSDEPFGSPGRKCVPLINECANQHTCSSFATCSDLRDGYSCSCISGYVDVSSELMEEPGRRCVNSSEQCGSTTLNTCDKNADCIETVDGYRCQCYAGYVDWSHSANSPPGRFCTIDTECPDLMVDLIFLLDGSGSIGPIIFKHEALRFVRQMVDLFYIDRISGSQIGVIQFSDKIRYEISLDQYQKTEELKSAVNRINHLTGFTHTGGAITQMINRGFSTEFGARENDPNVAKIGIVITDGRSQDVVEKPPIEARHQNISLFAVGVTEHVIKDQLIGITGDNSRVFLVLDYEELNTRLMSIIQKVACRSNPTAPPSQTPTTCTRDSDCDGAKNMVCIGGKCGCDIKFALNPRSGECGGVKCTPGVMTSCVAPEICTRSTYGDSRCACPRRRRRNPETGFCCDTILCTSSPPSNITTKCSSDPNVCSKERREVCIKDNGIAECGCRVPDARNPRNQICGPANVCNPNSTLESQCDKYLHEKCLIDFNGYSTCQCDLHYKRHPSTNVCLINECAAGIDECAFPGAVCTDTAEFYLCACTPDHIDDSPDKLNKPGRVCIPRKNECNLGLHNCSTDAVCINTDKAFLCGCKDGFYDASPNIALFPGTICKPLINECLDPSINDCSWNAVCYDTLESFICICKPSYVDISPLVKPAITSCSHSALNDCDLIGAICEDTVNGYLCKCKDDFNDISPQSSRPGRICEKKRNECHLGLDNCDRINGTCIDMDLAYTCACKAGFVDLSLDLTNRPGRICRKKEKKCNKGITNCSPVATCIDHDLDYTCKCPSGYYDQSSDVIRAPGQVCMKLINECLMPNRCHKNAICEDTPPSYRCKCKLGFVDTIPQNPGRDCIHVDKCLNDSLNDCHIDAHCISKFGHYKCKCKFGFVDRDPAHPGRICDRHTPPPTTEAPECLVGILGTCDISKNEICRIVGGQATCVCSQHYSMHPDTGECSVINECLFSWLHNCSEYANCIDLTNGYTCECFDGLNDDSVNEDEHPGRVCTKEQNECLVPSLNACDRSARCIDLRHGYTCKCRPGSLDMMPERPGRICRHIPDPCSDPDMHTCDVVAKCYTLQVGYTCECPPNYIDIVTVSGESGRQCQPLINECGTPERNDCDRAGALCEDTRESYICSCKENFIDISPNPHFPGRVCTQREDECKTGRNDCDKNAVCRDTEDGFTCTCPPSYLDLSKNKLHNAGRFCYKLENECLNRKHDCDPSADCRDLDVGFTCQCPSHMQDRSPSLPMRPGRLCLTDECSNPMDNNCDNNAHCDDLTIGYTCTCKVGYSDASVDRRKFPGRRCVPHVLAPTTAAPNNLIELCGAFVCLRDLGERCMDGDRCVCPDGHARVRDVKSSCEPAIPFTFPVLVQRRNDTTIRWSTSYLDRRSAKSLAIMDKFNIGVDNVYNVTSLRPYFISSEVDDIVNPSRQNSTLSSGGLWINAKFWFRKNHGFNATDAEAVHNSLIKTIVKRFNNSIGGTDLFINSYQPNPFVKYANCGEMMCRSDLGEVCVASKVCACEVGFGRRRLENGCVAIEGYRMELVVVRENEQLLTFNSSYLDPNTAIYQKIVPTFADGVDWVYGNSSLDAIYFGNEINEVGNPLLLNATMGNGLRLMFTVYFKKGVVTTTDALWVTLWERVVALNYSVGGTNLFCNQFQYNPFGFCINHDCDHVAICHDLIHGFRCKCPPEYEEGIPESPGRSCLRGTLNQCLHTKDNDCHPKAICTYQNGSYSCQCELGFKDTNRTNPGRYCEPDICFGKDEACGINMTCAEQDGIAVCVCKTGLVDVRTAGNLLIYRGLGPLNCIDEKNVNECDLKLTDCYDGSKCTDLPTGYSCECPTDFIDGNPYRPGRLCSAKRCDQCNGRGNCSTDIVTKQLFCSCDKWYSGDKCEKDLRMLLLIVFAVVFLLLGLCSLLFFSLRCRCLRDRPLWLQRTALLPSRDHLWHTLGTSSGSGGTSHDFSDWTIPRAKLKNSSNDSSGLQQTSGNVNERTERHLTNLLDEDKEKLVVAANQPTDKKGSKGDVMFDNQPNPDCRDAAASSMGDFTNVYSEYFTSDMKIRKIVESKRTATRAQVLSNATAEFTIYPPNPGHPIKQLESWDLLDDGEKSLVIGDEDYSRVSERHPTQIDGPLKTGLSDKTPETARKSGKESAGVLDGVLGMVDHSSSYTVNEIHQSTVTTERSSDAPMGGYKQPPETS